MPGPPPKRTTQRRRRNKVTVNHAPSGTPTGVTPPAGDPGWHPVAARWYGSLADSGQSQFYEPSDWATAYLVAESISRELAPRLTDDGVWVSDPPKGASMAAWFRAMGTLLVTEGDRRRLRLELEKVSSGDPYEEAAIADLEQFRNRLTAD